MPRASPPARQALRAAAQSVIAPSSSPKPLSNQENKSKNSDFNIFEFLDEAMEKSTIDLEELPKPVNSEINTVDTLRAKSTAKQDSYSVNDIKVEKKYDFNEKHLSHLETKINLSQKKNTSTSKKLLTIQKKLQNDPTKLGIVMQAIFDPPKSQGI